MQGGTPGVEFQDRHLTRARLSVRIGTQIGTRRLSTGSDRTEPSVTAPSRKRQKTTGFGTRWDLPGQSGAHFETAPFDRSGTSPQWRKSSAPSTRRDRNRDVAIHRHPLPPIYFAFARHKMRPFPRTDRVAYDLKR